MLTWRHCGKKSKSKKFCVDGLPEPEVLFMRKPHDIKIDGNVVMSVILRRPVLTIFFSKCTFILFVMSQCPSVNFCAANHITTFV